MKSCEYEPGVCEEPPDFQLMMDIFIGKLDAVRCITVSSTRIHIDPDRERGDKVNSGIGLSYLSARIHGLAGRYDNSMPESTLSPSQGSTELGNWTYIHR